MGRLKVVSLACYAIAAACAVASVVFAFIAYTTPASVRETVTITITQTVQVQLDTFLLINGSDSSPRAEMLRLRFRAVGNVHNDPDFFEVDIADANWRDTIPEHCRAAFADIDPVSSGTPAVVVIETAHGFEPRTTVMSGPTLDDFESMVSKMRGN